MKRIGSHASPSVRKVGLAWAAKKLDYQFEPDNAGAPDTTVENLHRLGTVASWRLRCPAITCRDHHPSPARRFAPLSERAWFKETLAQ